jgi:seryl-tRNA synthetase
MLDIAFIRNNKELIKEAARKKQIDFDVNELIEVDNLRRKLIRETEDLKAEQNEANRQIAKIKKEDERQKMINEMKVLKNRVLQLEKDLRSSTEEWRRLMLEVPNIPDPSVPEGSSEKDNQFVRKWGDPPSFDFKIKSHMELMVDLGLVDFERGAKVSGFRGYFLKKEAVELSFAVWRFSIDELTKKGFELFLAPALVRPDNLYGTGYLPHGQDDVYKTQDDLYLSATAEIPLTGYHANEILFEEQLPKKYLAFSPCFRREAGSYGKDTKGLYRLHEFYKLEQFILCRNDHQESVRWHEEITQNSESILRKLGLPYRVMSLCGGELGRAHVKTYDIEVWIPSEKRYRESHSSSYYHDFQTRRLNIRYRTRGGKVYFAHSLNNTAIATPRILIALLENNQQRDGSILIPEALQEYVGKERI